MPIIPSNLRAPLNKVTGGRAVSALLASNPGAVTLGIAAAQAGPSVVEVGGVRAAAAPYASAAVAVTRIERRGSRIWGALASGVGAVELAVTTGGQSSTLPFLYGTRHSPWTRSGPWANPLPLAADVVIEWDSTEQVRSNIPLGHYRIQVGRFAPGQSLNVFETVMGWLNANIGYAAVQIDNGTVTATVPAVTTREPNWQTAPAALAWAAVGLPWWGLVEAAARSGSWVRRLAWTDAGRSLRFEPGAGTTRAVAVQMASGLAVAERVTTADFGVAEFLAEDWVVASENESPLVDVTDFVFSGPVGAVLFAVFGVGGGGTGGTPGGGGSGQESDAFCATTIDAFIQPVIDNSKAIVALQPTYEAKLVHMELGLQSVLLRGGKVGCSDYYRKLIYPGYVPPSGGGGSGGGSVPQTGRGFVYVRDGVSTLVPARDITGADWEP